MYPDSCALFEMNTKSVSSSNSVDARTSLQRKRSMSCDAKLLCACQNCLFTCCRGTWISLYRLGLYKPLAIIRCSPPRSAIMLTEPERASSLEERWNDAKNCHVQNHWQFKTKTWRRFSFATSRQVRPISMYCGTQLCLICFNVCQSPRTRPVCITDRHRATVSSRSELWKYFAWPPVCKYEDVLLSSCVAIQHS